MTAAAAPLRLTLDPAALADNWRWLARRSGAPGCGAAVKADAYGIGADRVVSTLSRAGCRDVFVATWAEAAALSHHADAVRIAVLHGIRTGDLPLAARVPARPVLNSADQVARWREARPGAACDVMIDTGMNRLGLTAADARSGMLDGLAIDVVHSHLSSADDDDAASVMQRDAFVAATQGLSFRRRALANSAGVCLGADYGFDLVRPGLALYGGVPRAEAAGHIHPVAAFAAEVLQVRTVAAGDTIGYNRTHRAESATRVAVLQLGYADGYPRALSSLGHMWFGDRKAPVLGRVSMDLVTVDVTDLEVAEGDVARIVIDPPALARLTGRSQYEVLTGLASRAERSPAFVADWQQSRDQT